MASHVRQVLRESRFKAAVVMFLALVFWVGFFLAFLDGFRLIGRYEGISSVLHDVLFSFFFVSLMIMLTFSNAIICFSSFYRSKEMDGLLSSPLSLSSIIFYKFTESLTFSSWAFVLIALPFLIAYGVSVGAHPAFYPMIPLFFAPFVAIPGAMGTLLAIALATFFPQNRGKVLGALAVAVAVYFIILGLNLTDWNPGETVMDFQWMNSILGKLAFAQNPYVPSQWMSKGLISCAAGAFSGAGFDLLLLTTTAAFLYVLLDGACTRWFRASWARSQECGSRTVRKNSIGSFRFARGANDMILLKDLKIFVRDPVQWSQCAILFGVLAIYFLNLRSFRYDIADAFWKNMVAFLNLSATSLTLATLTTRFVFPMISMEGQRFWIIGLMPIARWQILRTKFLSVLIGSLFIMLLLTVTSNIMLGTTRAVLILQCIAAIAVCIGLSGLTVGFGVIFPNFRESDPSKIVSGFGGTLTLVMSMLYVGAIIILGVVPVHYCLVGAELADRHYGLIMTGSITATVLLTATACGLPLWLGKRAFDRLEL